VRRDRNAAASGSAGSVTTGSERLLYAGRSGSDSWSGGCTVSVGKAGTTNIRSTVMQHGFAALRIVGPTLDIRLLGPFQVLDSNGQSIEISGDLPRGILALLALSAPNPLSADHLRHALWDDAVASDGALHVAISRLRKTVGEQVIRTVPGGYNLDIPVAHIDLERFRRRSRLGQQLLTLGRPGKAAEVLRQSLAQWRGPPLSDVRHFDSIERTAQGLEEERLTAVEQLLEAEIEAGNHALVVGELSGLVETFPLRERFWEHLMLALYRSGRQAEGLRAFKKLEQILGDELGVVPSERLRHLEERILLHDPSLEDGADADLQEWMDEPELLSFGSGEVIVEQGGPGDAVYWIEEGRVEVLGTDDQGEEVALTEMGPGRYFGELAALLGTARTATVRAIEPTTVTAHSIDGFRARLGVDRSHLPVPIEAADEVRLLMGEGQYLQAYDVASSVLERHRADPELRYLAVLALARSGATAFALRRYEGWRLASVDPRSVSPLLAEDIAALSGRLDKDMCIVDPANAKRWAARSAEKYENAFCRFDTPYLAVNAATMWMLAGRQDRAANAAHEALARLDQDSGGQEQYWHAASEAEAALVTRDLERATEALARAGHLGPRRYADRATTLRQLRRVCDVLGIDPAILTPIHNPTVVHFCGHRIDGPGVSGRFMAKHQQQAAGEVEKTLSRLNAGFGFGSLAAGSDIIIAEALLNRGAELQIVLPFDREEFVRTSVAPSGEEWVGRFERCLAEATGVSTAVTSEYLGDPVLFDFCARLAMGGAISRSQFLETEAHQVAIWDGNPTSGVAGTTTDVERWRAAGYPSSIIPIASVSTPDTDQVGKRQIRALLFGDFAGFSRLTDRQLATFHDGY
jgi:DNA-binding SARP family transcriptional activator